MSTGLLSVAELSDSQFDAISDMVKGLCGINLHDGKRELVKARLEKRVRLLGMHSFEQYLNHVKLDQDGELLAMLDCLTTNLTYFFREQQHFDHLRSAAIPAMMKRHEHDRRLRVWSAGCSSGEEPYSLAITLRDAMGRIGNWDVGILATDLSSRVLAHARKGLYSKDRLRDTPGGVIAQHFSFVPGALSPAYQVSDEIAGMVRFARLNLMERWPMKGPFDIIFCRNVMIYFDKDTQSRLISRFWDILCDGGLLFVGHSESLTGIHHRFDYILPSVYRKP